MICWWGNLEHDICSLLVALLFCGPGCHAVVLSVLFLVCAKYSAFFIFSIFKIPGYRGDVPDLIVALEGFSLVRSDRNDNSSKSKGGGICVFVIQKWCSQFTSGESVCNSDIMLVCQIFLDLFISPLTSGVFYYVLFISHQVEKLQRQPP